MPNAIIAGAEFDELTTFAEVAAHRSFVRAARALGLSTTVVSRRIAALETRLGTRLLNRTTRSVAPTEAGVRLIADLAPALAGLTAARDRVAGNDLSPRGRLRINLPRLAAQRVVTPILPAFAERYPDIRIDLVIDDHFRDIVADGFDAGIRLGDTLQQDMIAQRLTSDFRMAVVGSPDYLRRHPAPRVPADLLHHRCLGYRFAEHGTLQRWQFDNGSGPVIVDPVPVLAANDTDTLFAAARHAMGLAYLGNLLVADAVMAGELYTVLEDWCPAFPGFYLYHPDRRLIPPPLRAFIDFLVERRSAAEAVSAM